MLRMPSILKKKPILQIVCATLLSLALYGASAWADNLEQLRASGAIGESLSGYVVAQRRAIYQQKAAAQGVSVDQVAKVYAAEIFKKIPAGTWVQKDNGQWVQK